MYVLTFDVRRWWNHIKGIWTKSKILVVGQVKPLAYTPRTKFVVGWNASSETRSVASSTVFTAGSC